MVPCLSNITLEDLDYEKQNVMNHAIGLRLIEQEELEIYPLLLFAESMCNIFFSLEMLIRFMSCPSKFNFVKIFQNWIDFVAIVSVLFDFAW